MYLFCVDSNEITPFKRLVNRFIVFYQQVIAMYDIDWQICCNRSRLKPWFKFQHIEVQRHR